jgi:thiol-disulfide isomerase/thioredoxin
MLDRFLILIALALLIGASWGLVQLWKRYKLRSLQNRSPLADVVPLGKPTVVSFSTPYCSECRARQAPAIQRLSSQMGDKIAVHSLSALEHDALVRQLGILTVPATVVLTPKGQIAALNLGYASDEQLGKQLQTAGL